MGSVKRAPISSIAEKRSFKDKNALDFEPTTERDISSNIISLYAFKQHDEYEQGGTPAGTAALTESWTH